MTSDRRFAVFQALLRNSIASLVQFPSCRKLPASCFAVDGSPEDEFVPVLGEPTLVSSGEGSPHLGQPALALPSITGACSHPATSRRHLPHVLVLLKATAAVFHEPPIAVRRQRPQGDGFARFFLNDNLAWSHSSQDSEVAINRRIFRSGRPQSFADKETKATLPIGRWLEVCYANGG